MSYIDEGHAPSRQSHESKARGLVGDSIDGMSDVMLDSGHDDDGDSELDRLQQEMSQESNQRSSDFEMFTAKVGASPASASHGCSVQDHSDISPFLPKTTSWTASAQLALLSQETGVTPDRPDRLISGSGRLA